LWCEHPAQERGMSCYTMDLSLIWDLVGSRQNKQAQLIGIIAQRLPRLGDDECVTSLAEIAEIHGALSLATSQHDMAPIEAQAMPADARCTDAVADAPLVASIFALPEFHNGLIQERAFQIPQVHFRNHDPTEQSGVWAIRGVQLPSYPLRDR